MPECFLRIAAFAHLINKKWGIVTGQRINEGTTLRKINIDIFVL